MAMFLLFFFTQQYSWAQDRIEFFLSVIRDINAIAFNSSGVSLVHSAISYVHGFRNTPYCMVK
jgi:hypothetical protein